MEKQKELNGTLQEVWYYAEGYQKVKISDNVYVTWLEWSKYPNLKVGDSVRYVVKSEGPTVVVSSTNRALPESCVELLKVLS